MVKFNKLDLLKCTSLAAFDSLMFYFIDISNDFPRTLIGVKHLPE